jgi:hypothetical protein
MSKRVLEYGSRNGRRYLAGFFGALRPPSSSEYARDHRKRGQVPLVPSAHGGREWFGREIEDNGHTRAGDPIGRILGWLWDATTTRLSGGSGSTRCC